MITRLNNKYIKKNLPKRPIEANKGTFGKVLVIAGSKKYPGAAYLACSGAYRVGVGLVTLATTKDVYLITAKKLPEATYIVLPNISELKEKILQYDVLLVGPGIGTDLETKEMLIKVFEYIKFLKNYHLKIIIDADGLNILSEIKTWWKNFNGIITPHPGEMARLLGLSIEQIQKNREKVAIEFSEKWQQVVVLKGTNTVISGQEKNARSPFANPLLATAGTGDILSGMIAGFLAQDRTLFDAACLAVYIHGQAAEQLKEKYGNSGMIASDLLLQIPKSIKNLSD